MSMQPMFTIQSSASSSSTSAYSIVRRLALARRRRERRRPQPRRPVLRRVLLEEALALPPVGVALHRERPAAEVRDERRRDVAVVGEQVALRDPLVGPEQLVEVRQLERAAARAGSPPASGEPLAPDLGRRLVVPQAEVDGRAQPALVRPLGEPHLGHDHRLDPDDGVPAHARHLRRLGERRVRRARAAAAAPARARSPPR